MNTLHYRLEEIERVPSVVLPSSLFHLASKNLTAYKG
jgi:sugar diacid utilization regulator